MGQRQPYKSKEARGQDVLDAIRAYFDRFYMSPTYEEIMPAVGFKSRGHLAQLFSGDDAQSALRHCVLLESNL